MESGVYLLHDDNSLTKMIAQAYASEGLLQRYIEDHPDLLAGDQIDPSDPRRWLFIQREMGVPAERETSDRWSLDHLFLDQDAVPTFVEVKRASDTRARREVVAQMLDYAANATEYWPVDRMREAFARRCTMAGLDPAVELATFTDDECDEQAFWELARRNLSIGRIRLLFVADSIPPSLRRIVEFLNLHMSQIEVLAVEIRQFAAAGPAGLRTLVPHVIGQTELARDKKREGRVPGKSEPIGRDALIEGIAETFREVARLVVRVSDAEGYLLSPLQNERGIVRAKMSLPGVPGAPMTLGNEYLWISLGKNHPALREEVVNLNIRRAILDLAPTRLQANDPKKSEVAIPLNMIPPTPESEAKLRTLYKIVRLGLIQERESTVEILAAR